MATYVINCVVVMMSQLQCHLIVKRFHVTLTTMSRHQNSHFGNLWVMHMQHMTTCQNSFNYLIFTCMPGVLRTAGIIFSSVCPRVCVRVCLLTLLQLLTRNWQNLHQTCELLSQELIKFWWHTTLTFDPDFYLYSKIACNLTITTVRCWCNVSELIL